MRYLPNFGIYSPKFLVILIKKLCFQLLQLSFDFLIMKLKEYFTVMLYNRRADEIVYSRALIFYCDDLFQACLDLKIRYVLFRLCFD